MCAVNCVIEACELCILGVRDDSALRLCEPATDVVAAAADADDGEVDSIVRAMKVKSVSTSGLSRLSL